jgi:predicted ATP-grasp superfamily ATP-dependent carboligase
VTHPIASRAVHRAPAVIVGLGMTGLGVVRSLSRHGVPLVAVDTLPRRPSGWTRLCRKVFVDPRGDLWDQVLEVGRRCGTPAPVLFLTNDVAVLEASARRERLSSVFRFHLPEPDVVRLLVDKTSFGEYAVNVGLPVPTTISVRGGGDWERVFRECPFPCVVKPKYRSPTWVAAGLPKAFRADSVGDLRRLLTRLRDVEGDYVVQEWIPGPDSAVFFQLAYYDGTGRPRIAFTGRKLRQWPPLVGSTSLAEAACSEEVDVQSRRLFELVRFRGLGSVEFKHDARDGRFKITEPTVGRPNLQSEVATANGVNIAYRAYCDLAGEPPCEVRPPAGNVRWIYLGNDLGAVLHYWRRKELSLLDFLRSYRPPRYWAEFSWRDPLPFLAIIWLVARNALRRLLTGARATAGE